MITQNKTLSPLDKQLLEEIYLVGKLYDEHSSRNTIHFDENGNLRFFADVLSPKPDALHSVMDFMDLFTSYDTRQYNFLSGFDYFSAPDRPKALREIFSNRIFMFRPQLTFNNRSKGYYFNFEIVLVEQVSEQELRQEYVPIPILEQRKATLETSMRENKPFLMRNYNHMNSLSQWLVCENYLYYFSVPGSLERHPSNNIGYKCSNVTAVRKMLLPKDWTEQAKFVTRLQCFASEDTLQLWKKEMDERGEWVIAQEEVALNQQKVFVAQSVPTHKTHGSEIEFLRQTQQICASKGLMLKQQDIVNFHVAVKTSDLTILAGMSGTGKTQLARTYASALGAVEGENMLTV
ncbi:MAG: hypothetical protein ACRCWQ_07310, partial [Bacilli bacterium]